MQKILNFDQSFHNFLRKNRLILVESRHLNFPMHFEDFKAMIHTIDICSRNKGLVVKLFRQNDKATM